MIQETRIRVGHYHEPYVLLESRTVFDTSNNSRSKINTTWITDTTFGTFCAAVKYQLYLNWSMFASFERLVLLLLTVVSTLCQAAFVKNLCLRIPSFLFAKEQTMAPNRQPASRSITSSPDTSGIAERTKNMAARAAAGDPLTDSELDDVVNSIKNIAPKETSINYDALRSLLSEIAHISHKDWTRTGNNSECFGRVLLPEGLSSNAIQMLDRILEEGNWNGAETYAVQKRTDHTPWAVLVTGVNGIRKTTTIYQSWFPDLLAEALIAPEGYDTGFDRGSLPCGANSFFRQLDHMIATLCNEDFAQLYALIGKELKDGEEPTKDLMRQYSNLKAAIFTRYRTLSELLGVWLLREAQTLKSNCMMETSGRDIAMFHYVDHFFPTDYKKLVLHFTVNDLSCAQQSVDTRMLMELKDGIEALMGMDAFKVIYANAGGPYGSEVLAGVQEASDRVWNEVVLNGNEIGRDWYKATITINAHQTEPWTAQAVCPDGSLGTTFSFERR